MRENGLSAGCPQHRRQKLKPLSTRPIFPNAKQPLKPFLTAKAQKAQRTTGKGKNISPDPREIVNISNFLAL
jgi:hypothetical protein